MKLPRFEANPVRHGADPSLVTRRNFDDLASVLAGAFQTVETWALKSQSEWLTRADVHSIVRRDAVWNVVHFGAKGDGVTDDAAAIQRALTTIAALGGGALRFPKGTYLIASQLTIPSNIRIFGDGKFISTLKVASGVTVTNFFLGAAVSNVNIHDLGFDNYDNYPNQNTVAGADGKYLNDVFPNPINTGIRFTGGGSNITVQGCYFYGMTGCSVRFQENATPWTGVRVLYNQFLYGSYILNTIHVSGTSTALPAADSAFTRDVQVIGNILNYNSSQKYVLPGIFFRSISNDAIHIDHCCDFTVSNNTVNYSGSIAIRVEECIRGEVFGNTILESGTDGISVYNSSEDIGIGFNTIKAWGRTPQLDWLRRYDIGGGTYVNFICREAPDSVDNPFPADPQTVTWIEENPYDLTGLPTSQIPIYNTANYYNASVSFATLDAFTQANYETDNESGVLPFRGGAAISVCQRSVRCRVIGNRLYGDTTQVGGKYTHASDYGISTVHPFNLPITSASPMIAIGNIISGCIKAEIYQPAYTDPISLQGAISGVRTYPMNFKMVGSTLTELDYTVPLAQVFESTVDIAGNLTLDADLILAAAAGRIVSDTADGSDSKSVGMGGGATLSHTRGAYVNLYGNEHSTDPGKLKLVAGAIAGGGNIEFWTNNALRMTINRVSGTVVVAAPTQITDILEVTGTVSLTGGLLYKYAQTGITASTTQTQGQGALTRSINIVSTCANANDTVTLPSAGAGLEVFIRNNGAQTLQIFPASGDSINGAAVNASTTLAANASVRYSVADNTNWYS